MRRRSPSSYLQDPYAPLKLGPQRQHLPSERVTLIPHDFGPEGSAYVRRYLEANARFGKRLGALLAGRDIEAGRTWALVPSASPPDRRADFEGSLFPPAGPAFKVEVGFMVPNFIPSANPQIRDAVGALLKRSAAERAILSVEDALGRRSDFKLAPEQWARQVFFCGDDVYDFAGANAPLDEAIRMLGGAEWRPDIGLVTSLPAEIQAIKQGNEVSTAQLREMADAAVAAILGAWDDDSLLFWEPRGSNQRSP